MVELTVERLFFQAPESQNGCLPARGNPSDNTAALKRQLIHCDCLTEMAGLVPAT
jgi:hypothetical protein